MLTTAALRRALALVVLTTATWAAALTVVNEPSTTGASSEFVTLGYSLAGIGNFDYSVQAPEGWEPLNRHGRVSPAGEGYVSVTFQIPRYAAAGSRVQVEIVFTNVDDPTDTVTGRGFVTVLGTVAVELRAPTDLEGVLGEPFSLSLLLHNRGNMTDIITLSGDGGMWDVRFESNPVLLEPGEERALQVVLIPQGQVSPGYRHVLRVKATSSNDPEVTAHALIETVFYEAARRPDAGADDDPELTLAIRSGLTAGLTGAAGDWRPHLSYDVNPQLSGELSDYVDVSAGVGDLSGNINDPFVEVPSRFDVALDAMNWEARARIGEDGASLSGSGVVNDWRIGGAGEFRNRPLDDAFGVSAFAISQLPELDLQFAARTSIQQTGRSDSLGARYSTSLGSGIVLSAGTSLTGNATNGDYSVAWGVDQRLSYQSQYFDVTQSYSGVPAAGLHNIGVSGGSRSAGLFAVRASSSLQLSPAGSDWRHGVRLSSRPLPRLTLSVSGSVRLAANDATLILRPSASLNYGSSRLGGVFTVFYNHSGVLRGESAAVDTYGVRTTMRSGGLTLAGAASYATIGATSDAPAGDSFTVSFDADYNIGLRTKLSAGYELTTNTVEGEQTSTRELAWTQGWTNDISSRLSYDRTDTLDYASGQYDIDERLSLVGQFSNLGVEGLDVSAGYALSSPSGLLVESTPLVHDFRVRLSYTLRFSFDTPPAIVNLFGGRRGGKVSGVAYFDRDLDGERDDGEEPIAGLELVLGGESVVTADDGSFRLRTGVGSHEWSFGSGLPGAVKLLSDERVEVAENSEQQLDLAFSPVVRVPLLLFDDVDQDGLLGPEEGGIPFGGVRFDGPMQVTVRLDARGTGSASGLVPGRYVVTPDPEALPPRYRATSEPVVLIVREGDTPATISLGAAAPPREVVTTFQAGNLAVIGRLEKTRAAVGDTITVSALVGGNPERVVALLGGNEFELSGNGPQWSGEIVVPEGLAAGSVVVVIRVMAGEVKAEAEVGLVVLGDGE